jgi:hypothetical protein
VPSHAIDIGQSPSVWYLFDGAVTVAAA